MLLPERPKRHSDDELDRLGEAISEWASSGEFDVEHDPALRRWYVRLRGEDKEVITIWLTVRERTVHHEAYVLPAPEENAEEVYAYFLRANARLYGMAFAIGEEEAIFLRGQVPIDWLEADALEAELDRIVGATYEYCERHFRTALRLAFASRFTPPTVSPEG